MFKLLLCCLTMISIDAKTIIKRPIQQNITRIEQSVEKPSYLDRLRNKTSKFKQCIKQECNILRKQYKITKKGYILTRKLTQRSNQIKICMICSCMIFLMIFRKRLANCIIYLLAPFGTYTNKDYPIRAKRIFR